MSGMKIAALIGFIASISHVTAHGLVSGIVADGVYYPGYSPNFQYSPTPPTVAGWSIPKDTSTGFIAPDAYANSDIICHLDATPGGTSVSVKAGGTVELQWTPWPTSHHGPVIDYLANCNGDCSSVDKTTLKFNKIAEMGLIDGNVMAGNWASDKLITANNSWTVTVPATTAPGNYVLRHEIIALHSAQDLNGAQNYPQCVNLKVTGAGTDSFASGTVGQSLYKSTDAGIAFNIYTKLTSYPIPGPTLYKGGVTPPKGNATSATLPQSTSAPVPQSTSDVGPSSSSISILPSTSGDIPQYSSAAVSGSGASPVEPATSTTLAAITSTADAYNTATTNPIVTYASSISEEYASPTSSSMSMAASTVTTQSGSGAPSDETVASTAVATTGAAETATADLSATMTPTPLATYGSSTSIADNVLTTSSASDAAPTMTPTVTAPAMPSAEPTTRSTGSKKSMKPLPPGITLEQLLDWLRIMLSGMFKDDEKKVHARAF